MTDDLAQSALGGQRNECRALRGRARPADRHGECIASGMIVVGAADDAAFGDRRHPENSGHDFLRSTAIQPYPDQDQRRLDGPRAAGILLGRVVLRSARHRQGSYALPQINGRFVDHGRHGSLIPARAVADLPERLLALGERSLGRWRPVAKPSVTRVIAALFARSGFAPGRRTLVGQQSHVEP